MKTISAFEEIEKALGGIPVEAEVPVVVAIPESLASVCPPLHERAFKQTEDLFRDWEHDPNGEQRLALSMIAEIYEAMATGELPPAYYLSSLAPGMGKTTTIIQSTRELLRDEAFRDVGVIIFLSRLAEIETLISLMGLRRDDVGVLTSNLEINALGRDDPTNASVLFTTQQKLESFAKGNGVDERPVFADMKEFHYNGRPRAVRIWDETTTPSVAHTLTRRGLLSLTEEIERHLNDKALADLTEEFATSLRTFEGNRIQMPDIDKSGLTLNDFKSRFSDSNQEKAGTYWWLSGREVRVHRDNHSGNVTLGWDPLYPSDLAPMLILDASGGLRQTYRFWKARGDLKELPQPPKLYPGLVIHHWDKGAGKGQHRKPETMNVIADGVMKMLSEIPTDEDILIVHHQKQPGKNSPDMRKTLERRIPTDRASKVRFCNWGRHSATNEFKDCRYVILAGILHYDSASYEAMGRGAKALSVDDEFSKEDVKAIQLGEISHHIFQAAGRGAIRKTVKGECPDGCHLYVIFATRSDTGVPQGQLLEIFPGATVEDWYPDGKTSKDRLRGKVREAVEFITNAVAASGSVTTTEVREALGMDRGNFNNNVLNHPDFDPALKAKWIMYEPGSGRRPGRFWQPHEAAVM
ncbi:hypothetical protein [Chelativorans sp. AA-79]|uniref:hypothetical protein n=1 Tax=Chelativorans sp. AA-79 TaxID=3028735 RepID=UPI0023F64D7F|nr:hypothetical protein [Chelativorans sp. AA-79]WEX07293.1 hypothetical protein PVE73_14245 [Chelativorans sp. AA-79]